MLSYEQVQWGEPHIYADTIGFRVAFAGPEFTDVSSIINFDVGYFSSDCVNFFLIVEHRSKISKNLEKSHHFLSSFYKNIIRIGLYVFLKNYGRNPCHRKKKSTSKHSEFVVLKFGGSSVSSKSTWDNIFDILSRRSSEHHPFVVCSALSGIF